MHGAQHVTAKGRAGGAGDAAAAEIACEVAGFGRRKRKAHRSGGSGNLDVVVFQPDPLPAEGQVVFPFHPNQVVGDVVGVGDLGVPGIPSLGVNLIRAGEGDAGEAVRRLAGGHAHEAGACCSVNCGIVGGGGRALIARISDGELVHQIRADGVDVLDHVDRGLRRIGLVGLERREHLVGSDRQRSRMLH